MASQNEALTKDPANLERYRQNRVYQADRQSARTGSSSWPFREILELDQTTAPANSTSFINGETRTGKDLKACLVRKQDTLVVIATGNPGTADVLVYGDVTISFSAMEVHRSGEVVALTRKEFQTLAYFLKNVDWKCKMRKGRSLRRTIWNWLLLRIELTFTADDLLVTPEGTDPRASRGFPAGSEKMFEPA